MDFECTINRKSAKEIYKKTGKNVGITIIKIIFCFLAICLFLFLLIKDIAMILLLAGSLIATVIFLIIYYQRQLNMICPKRKTAVVNTSKKWHFSKMKLRYQEIWIILFVRLHTKESKNIIPASIIIFLKPEADYSFV